MQAPAGSTQVACSVLPLHDVSGALVAASTAAAGPVGLSKGKAGDAGLSQVRSAMQQQLLLGGAAIV